MCVYDAMGGRKATNDTVQLSTKYIMLAIVLLLINVQYLII